MEYIAKKTWTWFVAVILMVELWYLMVTEVITRGNGGVIPIHVDCILLGVSILALLILFLNCPDFNKLKRERDLERLGELLNMVEPVNRATGPNADCMIWSNDHAAWWAPHSRGYTKNMNKAGLYTRKEAEDICKGSGRGRNPGEPPPEVWVQASRPVFVSFRDEDLGPNPRRIKSVESSLSYLFNGFKVYYSEYGSGAEIVSESGAVVSDFPNHLDAERFLDALPHPEAKT